MPKIKNWSRDDNPKYYQVTVWNGLNNRCVDFSISSLKTAMNSAREIARKNPDGKLISPLRE